MRIFFSFSSRDYNLAKPLVEALRATDEVFFSPDSIPFGAFWTPALADEIDKSDAVVLLVAGDKPGPWQLIEYYAALDRQVKNPDFKIVPVVLGGETNRFPFLGLINWMVVDNAAAGAAAAKIKDALVRGVGTAPSPWKHVNPFRDLLALDETNADLFFGREQETADAIRRLADHPGKALALVGNSGVGKSSLAQAGIVAALRSQRADKLDAWPQALKDSRAWLYMTMKPGDDPVLSLANAFLDEWRLDETDPADAKKRKGWIEGLRDCSFSLEDLMQASCKRWSELDRPKPEGVFLYVDQGEEVYSGDKVSAARFSALLAEALLDHRFRLVFSLRSDHYGYLQADTVLFPKVERLDVAPMGETQLADIMRRSAAALGAEFAEADLPDRIADAAAAQPGAMALLSVYLADLWGEMQRGTDGILRLATTQQSIDIASVLKARAEAYYRDKPARQKMIERLFVPKLVRVPKDGPALRRRVSIAKLDPQQKQIVEDLAQPDNRLLVTGDGGPSGPIAEVAHEALFSAWPRLNGWIESRRGFLEWKDGIEHDRAEWEKVPKRKNLLMGGKLDRAQGSLREHGDDIEQPERSYILRSRSWWRLQKAMAVAVVLLVFVILSGALLLIGQQLDTTKQTLEQAQRNESLFLAEKAEKSLAEGYATRAVQIVLEGLPFSVETPPESKSLDQAIRFAKEALYSVGTLQIRPLEAKTLTTFSRARTAAHFAIGKPMQHESTVNFATYSPNGTRVITGSEDRNARLWDAKTGEPFGEPMHHEGPVRSAAISPDEERVVTASRDTAWLWDAETGEPVGKPMHHKNRVNSATFSPDGTRVVTASDDNTARLWDAETGEPVGKPMLHKNWVNSATFSPDGTRVVTVSDDNTARLWDAETGAAFGHPMSHKDDVNSAAFSPDGTIVVTASDDNTARLWNGKTGAWIGEPMRHNNWVNSATISSDGTRVVTASGDHTARLWDAKTGKAVGEPVRHTGFVNSAAFSPDGTRVVTAGDTAAQMWDAATNASIGKAMQHNWPVNSAVFSPNGTWVVTASDDYTARVWDAATGAPIGEPMRHDGPVKSAVFSPRGTRVITASDDYTARLWDAATGAPIGVPMRHELGVNSADFSPNGTLVVTASYDTTARLWNGETGAPVGEPMHHESWVNSATFSPDGTRIVTTSGNAARLWDGVTGAWIGEPMRHERDVNSAAFSRDGTLLVTASDDTTARLWDAVTGTALGEPMRHSGSAVGTAAFSPDGKRVVTTMKDGARLWDTETSAPIGEPMHHKSWVNSATFSPDGTRVVTASNDHVAQLWQGETGAAIGEPLRHDGLVYSAMFSQGGRRLVTSSYDNTARVWDASQTISQFVARVRAELPFCLTAIERFELGLSPRADIETNPNYCKQR